MKNPARSALNAILFIGLSLSATSLPGMTQDDADVPVKQDPAVKEKTEALKEAVSDRAAEKDQEAIGILDELLVKSRAPMHRNDQRAVQRSVAAVFTTGRLRPSNQLALYQATATVLGELGREGARALRSTYENNRRFPKKPEWVPFRAILLENIGKTKEESMVKFLMDEARRSPEKALMAAAGAALGYYNESDQRIRKDIVKNLLIRWGELDATWRDGNTDPNNIVSQTAGEFLAAIKDKWNSTLVQMTGQNIGTYFDWQQWSNSNKNKNWDKG